MSLHCRLLPTYSTKGLLLKTQVKYKISDIADKLGIGISTLKYYEKTGQIPKAQRDENNFRYYTEADLLRIKAHFITKNHRRGALK